MTDFAIRYSYFDRKLGKSEHGEAIIRIQSGGEGGGESEEGKSEGEGESEGLDLDNLHHREAIEMQLRDALVQEYLSSPVAPPGSPT